MGKGRPRAVEKGVLGQNLSVSSPGSVHVPPAPVYYPSEEEFKDPLEYIYKIRAEAEKYGICKIVPPKSWSPPFALNLDGFNFPTKTQAIHQLQARPASCDSKTFELEYKRFLEDHCGKKLKKRVIFEGEELDLCKLFNAVKRFGGYDKVVKEKKWGEVSKFVRSGKKISECAKHVLCQLYFEHLYDYEKYYNRLNKDATKSCKRGVQEDRKKCEDKADISASKRRRKNVDGEKVKVYNKAEKEKEEELDQICEQCRSGLHGEVMLLCDRCNKGWHIYCLSPPLKQIPPGNWYCFECLNSDKDSFGFVPGKRFTVEAFRRLADRAKRKWFGSGSASRVQMEKKFWEIVEGSAGEVEVMYGSDLDTSIYGSGFPRVNDQRPESIEPKLWDEYCSSPWNLNNLPKLKGSMLQAVHHNITGVMVPWLYIGMLFSSFCWHFEDHCFYSMNYHHWGEPKCWYSVPGHEVNAFEKVMRNSLPDLFDAQPDLLFQLVTMLNPSVLQENGVPVYSVLQEPGNFVITFPRSYHGGFNFGLNCAEAVNFAPADWLPHGGFGADRYQMYHKTAVLSHEELLCVVAKFGNCDDKVSPYLKKELLRIYTKEKSRRERLWRSGIVKSSPMLARKCPEYVGTEEDPTCIICKQYLYLSAVVCHCRPSAYVCLAHWEHICECKSSRLRLLYRHTLAELYDLVLTADKFGSEERSQSNSLQRQSSRSNEMNVLTKKVKGGHVSLAQLAEQWLLRSSKVFQNPYSGDAFATLLKEAEQFLWAGSEMDSVRDMTKNLTVAHKWAEGIRDSLSRIEKWSCCGESDFERVQMEYINELLSFDPVPCNEPGHLRLKKHAEEARLLIQEIDSALSSCSKISDLDSLYSRACDFPIYIKESEKLLRKISPAKAWIENARKCISEKSSAAVDIDFLYKLKSEISELQVELPEVGMLLDLSRQAELCKGCCSVILKSPSCLKDVEVLLQEWGKFTVKVPELMLLKQYHLDAVSWIARYDDLLVNAHEREEQDIVVNELKCLLKDGASLKIQVDKLSVLEVELKKACCRQKAMKAHESKMPLDFIQQLMMDATVLQIENEKLFVDISGVLATALSWEERAVKVLEHKAQMSDFEDIIRSAADISVILPSLEDVKDAVVVAKCWLKNSEAFLRSSSVESGYCSLLKLEALKELILQSKLLKITLAEQRMLEMVLKNCEEWEQVASSALQDAGCILGTSFVGDGKTIDLTARIGHLVAQMESIIKAGISLGFDFLGLPELQNACSVLQWCSRALSFYYAAPSLEDVESLMETSEKLSVACTCSSLWSSLIDGVKWLRKALEVISLPSNFQRCKLSEAEEVLVKSERINVSFPIVVDQLVNAIEKHKLWREQVDQFFHLNFEERSWSQILKLKELGEASAFACSELDMILSEVEKVEKWKQRLVETVGILVDDQNPLLGSLQKIKQSLDTSCYILGKLQNFKARKLFMCCSSYHEDQEFLNCSACKDCYHLQCLEPASLEKNNVEFYICPYCCCLEDPSMVQNEVLFLRFGGSQPELSMLIKLLSDAEHLSIGIQERDALQQIVEQALECKTCLREILDFEASYLHEDLNVISKKIIIALKAAHMAGVYEKEVNYGLEMALARNSWRVKAKRLLDGAQKPAMQQIQQHTKEGLALNIPPEDYFRQKLIELKHIGLQWADRAEKVALDSGNLGLDHVFELLSEGENLPVSLEKELKLLKSRSMLYCICRKPYDDRAKVTCDRCDEWYHIDCVNILYLPKIYVCAACDPQQELSTSQQMDNERATSSKFVEPKTPSPTHTIPRKKPKETDYSIAQEMLSVGNSSNSTSNRSSGIDRLWWPNSNNSTSNRSSGIDRLWWRNRKPFRRAARKRAELESLSPFFHIQQ
ncbi:lysine-specific demethylase 5B isoform X2 [Jatropha curcas]|uniref:lysine-specific demethylase 5B isoform X2 n=1 Tax=Jatropha curcas TaxID=180498 RepID=UPI0005FAF676|nr:lysine-specific demethylase 5B isoform X2 [Jatropha curcas]